MLDSDEFVIYAKATVKAIYDLIMQNPYNVCKIA